MAVNLKLQHAREFTDVETEVLTIWNALQDAGNGSLARDFVDAGLMEEHFLSLLDNDPASRTDEERKISAELHARRTALEAEARAALGGKVDSKND